MPDLHTNKNILMTKQKLRDSINKFSWAQMVSNSDGKTSSSGFVGVVISLTGCLTFLFGAFFKHTEVLTQSVIIIGIGSSLLGYRKSQPPTPEDEKKQSYETDNNTNIPSNE